MPAPLVFFDLAGPDAGVLREFYARVFGWSSGEDGRFEVVVKSPVQAAFRTDPAEKRLYLGVDDIEATLAQVSALGGSVDVPRFEVPGVVVLGLFRDPAGNPMGLVELADGEVRLP